jgi:hypothetical protein
MSLSRHQVAAAIAEKLRPEKKIRLIPLRGGRNNRVYRIDSRRGPFVLKIYFRNQGDQRDRRSTEYRFARFLWKRGFRSIARPVCTSARDCASIFSLLSGKIPKPDQIGPREILCLRKFLIFCWGNSRGLSRRSFPKASEACFSLRDFEILLLARINNAMCIKDQAVRMILKKEILPTLMACRSLALFLGGEKWWSQTLPSSKWMLSPADHGFQNSLRTQSGLKFFDFEYAGWDDPVTVVSNACLHPGVPFPEDHQALFVRSMMAGLSAKQGDWLRLRIVFPLQALKWALIFLNPLLNMGKARRKFSRANRVAVGRRRLIYLVRRQARVAQNAIGSNHWLATEASLRQCMCP